MDVRVKEILENEFRGASVEVRRFAGAQRLSGHIAWEGFEDQEQIDRQESIWRVLREQLGDGDQAISVILTYTPRELELMRAA